MFIGAIRINHWTGAPASVILGYGRDKPDREEGMNQKQELHCHNCDNYVRFDLDLSVDGDYKLICPSCGHEHYRVVKDGNITDQRWGRDPSQANGGSGWTTIYATSWAQVSYQATSASTNQFTTDAWASTMSTWA